MSIISNTHTNDTCAVCASEIDHFAFVSGGRALCAGCYLRLLDYIDQRAKPTLRTANLSVQAEYALYVGDEPETPALPASKFQLQQAVRTAFWCRASGRIVSISHNGTHYFYEVQTRSGRIVLEPEAYLTAAPELEATLPQCETRRALTSREIEARMDTPDYDSGASSAYCQWNGIDQLNPDIR